MSRSFSVAHEFFVNNALRKLYAPIFDEGSFRDRSARVFVQDDRIFRALNIQAERNWRLLSSSRFFRARTQRGDLVGSYLAPPEFLPQIQDENNAWCAVLEHERVPFISYAYEWSFSMLRDGALLHLDLLDDALQENFTIKDSSHFNIQWKGVHPVFIDIPSFEPYASGDPWVGYRQFCEMFLFPLMLRFYRGIQFQPLLRASLDGVPVSEMSKMVSLRDYFRSGIFKHVWLQSVFQTNYKATSQNVKHELKQAGFHKELILANIRGLKKLLKKFVLSDLKSTWSDYAEKNSYSDQETSEKKEAVERFISIKPRHTIWDLGSNTGVFAEIAAKHAESVLAIDGDAEAVERLYLRLRKSNEKKILPLVMNLTDPSPRIGFGNSERKLLGERGSPSLTLALALIHHIVIGGNVPVERFIDWLASFGGDLVIEYVSREDEMVQTLLRNKEDNYTDYTEANLEACLARSFHIDAKVPLKSGKRVLYSCRRI